MRKIAGVVAALLVASLVPSSAFAWGAVAHRYITRRAVDLLPAEIKPFFDHFRDELVLRSNDPDLWRLMFPEEAPNHHLASSITATASAIAGAWEHAGRPVLREGDVRPVEKVRRP